MSGDDDRSSSSPYEASGSTTADGLSPVFRAIADARPAGRALDLATGTGRNALALAARGWTVDAVDISRTKLDRARDRERPSSADVNWILADVDSYCLPAGRYDLVTVSFFDALDRLPAVIDALSPGGLLCYEHYLASPANESGPGDRYRFEANELLTACSDLTILYYAERRADGQPVVTLVARDEGGDEISRWRPRLPSDPVSPP